MSKDNQTYKRPITMRGMAERVYKREDNQIYRLSMIMDVLNMYFDEMERALENGEKVGLHKIGSLNPRVHTPLTYALDQMNSEGGNKPRTDIRFTRSDVNKQKMNNKFLKNIKNGIAGLGENCMCNTAQKNILIEEGLLESPEGEFECLEK